MFKMFIDWLLNLWNDTDHYAEELVNDDTEYLRNKYGINKKYADE